MAPWRRGYPPPQAAAAGSGMSFSLSMLAVVYFANNWKMVLALQNMIMQLLAPFLQARSAASAARSARVQAAQQDEARRARLERLKGKTAAQ